MQILGVGLSKTGTTSLHVALQRLGYKCLHYDRVRLNDILFGSNSNPSFRRYDDIDAVTDIPSAYFYHEILQAYPECKAILTIREVGAWWKSIEYHTNTLHRIGKPSTLSCLAGILNFKNWRGKEQDDYDRFRTCLRNTIYGSVIAYEYLYKKKYSEHNERVQNEIPSKRLLVIDFAHGDGWAKLCTFLEKPTPNEPFPYINRTEYSDNACSRESI